jgi:hypothetical protein
MSTVFYRTRNWAFFRQASFFGFMGGTGRCNQKCKAQNGEVRQKILHITVFQCANIQIVVNNDKFLV